MKRSEALEILGRHKQELAGKYGVTRIGIFGSVARDEAASTTFLQRPIDSGGA